MQAILLLDWGTLPHDLPGAIRAVHTERSPEKRWIASLDSYRSIFGGSCPRQGPADAHTGAGVASRNQVNSLGCHGPGPGQAEDGFNGSGAGRGAQTELGCLVSKPISVDHLFHLCYTDAQPLPPAGVLLCETAGACEVFG